VPLEHPTVANVEDTRGANHRYLRLWRPLRDSHNSCNGYSQEQQDHPSGHQSNLTKGMVSPAATPEKPGIIPRAGGFGNFARRERQDETSPGCDTISPASRGARLCEKRTRMRETPGPSNRPIGRILS
jgi:hypothetical protein